jgi:AAA+ superfamily predicted ATPase
MFISARACAPCVLFFDDFDAIACKRRYNCFFFLL